MSMPSVGSAESSFLEQLEIVIGVDGVFFLQGSINENSEEWHEKKLNK